MLLEFNPRVSGGFVEYILRNPRLENFITELRDCEFTEKEIHDAFKDIIIAAFSEFKVDINDEINKAKKQAVESGH